LPLGPGQQNQVEKLYSLLKYNLILLLPRQAGTTKSIAQTKSYSLLKYTLILLPLGPGQQNQVEKLYSLLCFFLSPTRRGGWKKTVLKTNERLQLNDILS
ncbi:hypothetical protein, partial [Flavobacterium lacus]|uniref:hypothetical protein n=1 Tax=Flavobacterium lacus TaxID=1353778 RepID=UPI001C660821